MSLQGIYLLSFYFYRLCCIFVMNDGTEGVLSNFLVIFILLFIQFNFE